VRDAQQVDAHLREVGPRAYGLTLPAITGALGPDLDPELGGAAGRLGGLLLFPSLSPAAASQGDISERIQHMQSVGLQ
jgi:hypothetical protein